MTTPVLHCDADDHENTFLRDNSRKKTYAEVTQETNMDDSSCDEVEDELENHLSPNQSTDLQTPQDTTQPETRDGQPDGTWEIQITPELKNQLAGPWKTSIILKLMGRPLGYRALQSRLAGIWRPTGTMHLIDIGYGYFIMRFDVIKDYHHALKDGPWFVGDQYLHVQAWEADFHPHIAKITKTAVWIRLEQLPIEYHHQEFLKHVGQKLGKLLKVDAITSAAIRGRYARVCVQIDIANPLPKRVKIGTFWLDIVYKNLPMLCYKCGKIGHREPQCPENITEQTTTPKHTLDPPHPTAPPIEPTQVSTPWKTVQTRRTRVRTRQMEQLPRGKTSLLASPFPDHPRGQSITHQAAGQNLQQLILAPNQSLDVANMTASRAHGEVANQNNKNLVWTPCEEGKDCMHAPYRAECPSLQPRLREVEQERLHAHAASHCP